MVQLKFLRMALVTAFFFAAAAPLLVGDELIWDESFNDNRNNWHQDASIAIRNGRYEFFNAAGDAAAWRGTPMRDGRIQTVTG